MTNQKHDHDPETILAHTSFNELSSEERDRAWEAIARVTTRSQLSIIPKPMITSLIVALALIFGAGGTAALANSAVPGDTLFGVDRAVENIRISLASEEKKNELRIKFADERVKEIESIASVSSATERPPASDVTETTVTDIEAGIFTNETVIKIEYSGKKFVFVSKANSKESIIDEIVSAFPALSRPFVTSKLDIETEDRSSRADDKRAHGSTDDLSDEGKIRVTTGVATALALLNGVSTSVDGDSAVRLKAITDELNAYLKSLPSDSTVDTKIKEDDKRTRVDLRSEEGRIRVEIRDDGEIRIKTDNEDDDEEKDDDSEEDEKSKDDDSTVSDVKVVRSLEIEAGIFTNETVVKVELNDRKSTFTTDADTRAEIVAAVLVHYPSLTQAQVERALKIETEDRASRIKDLTGTVGNSIDQDDDSDDDSEVDDDDDSEDDNDGHSGRGGGDEEDSENDD